MEFFKHETKIDFMGFRRVTGIISIILCLCSVITLLSRGLYFGLEFTGGTQVELRFDQPVELDEVREQLESFGFGGLRVQNYGSTRDVLIRIASADVEDETKVSNQLRQAFNNSENTVEIRKVEYVGSEVGHELAEQGGIAVLVAILSTMIYIALRFEYRFAVSAAIALCHDSLIVLGLFSLLQVEFDLATLAAVLAVVGYSLNDTIVVFDRVRENFRKIRKGTTAQIMNFSINQTLSRTLMTSWLTLLVVLALLIYGGSSLFGFSLALCLGIVIGTYSSIYVAGAFALFMGLSKQDLMPRPKAEIDDLP